jgi:GAF domain-containing protein
MSEFSLRDYIFKDRPGEEPGRRTVFLIALVFGLIITIIWIFAYQNPLVRTLAFATSASALFSLVQFLRGRNSFPFIIPIIAMMTVTAISILEGNGSHDLIWMGGLGLYLLANIFSAKNDAYVFAIGVIILASFIGIGLLEINGFLPNSFGTNLEYIFVNAAIMLGIMGAITAVFHNHRFLTRVASESRVYQISARESLEQANRTLEEQVKLRTDELRKVNEQLLIKTAKLQAASDITQSLLEHPHETTNELLTRTTRLISEKLGYYHAGIFLVDSARGFAVLQAANSKGGQEMLVKRHQLKVGGTGIVGYVSQSGRPRIALDAGADAVYFNNPYLPETRSEISLPIKVGNAVIGVLDVQSTQPAAFNEEDTSTLMTIANQLAVILQRNEDQGIPASKSGRRFVRAVSWEKQSGYTFRSDGSIASSTDVITNPSVEKAIATGETLAMSRPSKGSAPTLAVPVKFRDQVVGVIHIESDEPNRNWTEDEVQLVQSISDRAALALENARLLEDATRRAEQEETISRVTTHIGASTDFERIMQTTIQELGLALGASRSFIQIGSQSDMTGKTSE